MATPLVSGIMQARSGDRLRASIGANFDLVDRLRDRGPEWQQEVNEVDVLLRRQINRVKARDEADLDRRIEWSALGALIFLYVIGIPLLYLLYQPDRWWSWTLYWVLLIFLLVMTVAGFERALNSPVPSAHRSPTAEPPRSS
ncbi:hypothetical protein NX801_30230 [Streptomyces sp. LP05-1]|uniref:Integral membrane protein n=1 Tax=Streptomyces pyxinae TaxID=2970734 RepID=A0ABT2CQY8_9ACTN|nr:hypothetical protein [Streptomyces sp. LP05-1]MCS0639839.1 hypothetical protein [Streptomyces sp. LP05-1]